MNIVVTNDGGCWLVSTTLTKCTASQCCSFLYNKMYIYNSVSYDPTELRKIHDTVDAIILDKCEKSIITIDDIRTSIASLIKTW